MTDITKNSQTITSLSQAIDYFQETRCKYPERDAEAASLAAIGGTRRKYPVLTMRFQPRSNDKDKCVYEYQLPEVSMPATDEGGLARDVVNLLAPLQMLNPVGKTLSLGDNFPSSLIPSFGIPLNPEAQNSPAFTRSMEDVLSDDPPDPANSGLLSDMHRRIDLIKEYLPDYFKISLPDMQGPYNLAHAIVGEDAFLMPHLHPDRFHRLMERITVFWIEARKNLLNRIGQDRLHLPITTIAECSTNLISSEMYKEFVLPYDIQIAETFGSVNIHTCSGPHIFHVTLENIPNVVMTEAGFVSNTAAGHTPIEEALKAIGDRPVTLRIGQELPEGNEFEFVKKDLDLYDNNPRLLFDYTGMHWWNKDCPRIRDIHRRLDEYWENK